MSQRPLATGARALVFFGVAITCVATLHDISGFYGHFRIPYGIGVNTTPAPELLFYVWYGLLGTLAALCLVPPLQLLKLPQAALHCARWCSERVYLCLGLGALIVFCLSLIARFGLLLDAPITDDESTYLLIAQTLLEGGVTLPAPEDYAFFQNQFVTANAQVWYGKYPIGHPALLAIGEAIGARFLIVPLLSSASFLLTYAIGRRIFSTPIALLAAGLLLLSPQFVLTHATQLSQPASGFFLLLGLWTALKLHETSKLSWAGASGLAWAACLLVRPFPGVLFLPVIAAFALKLPLPKIRKAKAFAIALLPVLLAVVALFAINRTQSGGWTKHSYQKSYNAKANTKVSAKAKAKTPKRSIMRKLHIATSKRKYVSSSWASALLRQAFWLLGAPLFLVFLCFVRIPTTAGYTSSILLFGPIAAIYLYRFLIPKTVVATTGPIYVAEATPLLCLLLAAGITHVARSTPSQLLPRPTHTTVGLVLGLIITSAAMFFPFQSTQLQRGAFAWHRPLAKLQALKRRKQRKLLVFANRMTHVPAHDTWAYFPPNPHPSLREDIIFVRRMVGPKGGARNYAFWRKRFPKRLPVYLSFDRFGNPMLRVPHKPDAF